MSQTPHFVPPVNADGDRTLAALATAAKGFVERSTELEAAICEYVARLKADGLPPEHVVISVKEVIVRSGLGRDPGTMNVLIDGVVTLCIQQFYQQSLGAGEQQSARNDAVLTTRPE